MSRIHAIKIISYNRVIAWKFPRENRATLIACCSKNFSTNVHLTHTEIHLYSGMYILDEYTCMIERHKYHIYVFSEKNSKARIFSRVGRSKIKHNLRTSNTLCNVLIYDIARLTLKRKLSRPIEKCSRTRASMFTYMPLLTKRICISGVTKPITRITDRLFCPGLVATSPWYNQRPLETSA